jgi:hypothetical protein
VTPAPGDDRAPGTDRGAGAAGAGPTASRRARRTDPLGKESLFTAPVAASADQLASGDASEGRAALFSTGPRRPGTVVVTCEGCSARSRVSLVDLGLRFATGSAWWPLRRHAHWMRCPSCGRRTWCAIDWTA